MNIFISSNKKEKIKKKSLTIYQNSQLQIPEPILPTRSISPTNNSE
jgi:hypothetical protein